MNHFVHLIAIILAFIAILALSACATNTGNPATDRRNATANDLLAKAASTLGQVAVTTLATAVAQEKSGGKVNWQHAAAQSLWQQASSIATGQDLANLLAGATANHTPNTVATAKAELEDAQSRGISTLAAVNAIASALSGTALAVPPLAQP